LELPAVARMIVRRFVTGVTRVNAFMRVGEVDPRHQGAQIKAERR